MALAPRRQCFLPRAHISSLFAHSVCHLALLTQRIVEWSSQNIFAISRPPAGDLILLSELHRPISEYLSSPSVRDGLDTGAPGEKGAPGEIGPGSSEEFVQLTLSGRIEAVPWSVSEL